MYFRDPNSIPLPETHDEFERLCLYISRDRYGPEFYRYARTGQTQYGIDIYSTYYDGRYLQCKHHKKDVSNSKIATELKKDLRYAKRKFNDLKQFIFAVSVEIRPTIQDLCKKLCDDKVRVIPWFWNQLQEDIAQSKWLLRYCFDYEPGAQWISDDFVEQEQKKGDEAGWQPLQYYSSIMHVQWYGLLQGWDAPRQQYEDIRKTVADSFADEFSDMPVAAVVLGEGGSGKSVLLRRLALDLRNEYTVYWIADNATDFFQNEWLYDIENNSKEKYLLVLEDWYRNFSNTTDRALANNLLQKVKRKFNVRLLIGDRPTRFPYYPKTDKIIFHLKSKENAALLSYIINIVPDWKDKFTEHQSVQLYKLGLFQMLFIYQYSDGSKLLPKAKNYFMEIIESDYKHLTNSEYPFYKGLAYTLYIYANLNADLNLPLSIEALIVLAETYSGAERPFELRQNINNFIKDPVVKRYLTIVIRDYPLFGGFQHLYFLHDTLVDQGWKYVSVNSLYFFGSPASISQLADALKTEKTAYDLAGLLFQVLRRKRGVLTKEQILSYCDYLVTIGCESYFYVRILFTEELINMSDTERLTYLRRLIGLGNQNRGFWHQVLLWMKKRLNEQDRKDIILKLVKAGNICYHVLIIYFQFLNEIELKEKAKDLFTVDNLMSSFNLGIVSVFLKRLGHDGEILKTIRKYLQSPAPEKISQNFTVCLRLLKEEKVAKDAARKYLQSPEPEKISQNFTVCLMLLKEEEVAKDAARKYLQSPEPEKTSENFTVCLRLLKEEKVAKDAARKYLQSPKPEKIHENFTICLQVLGSEAKNIVASILKSPIEKQNPNIIYCALQIAKEIEELNIAAEDMVHRILSTKRKYFNKAAKKNFYLYLQMMKIPLFHIKSWQVEVDKLLQKGPKINRNLFYSLILSHIDKSESFVEVCLFYIRNWKQEFQQPKKYWDYFIQSLAHPKILEKPDLKKEIRQLCRQMLLADNCPFELKAWLRLITEENKFPLWKIAEEDEL
jgi:hypothetical protein